MIFNIHLIAKKLASVAPPQKKKLTHALGNALCSFKYMFLASECYILSQD